MSRILALTPLAVGLGLSWCVACQQTSAPPVAPKPPASAESEEPEPEESLVAPSPPDPKLSPTRVSLAKAPKAGRSVLPEARSGLAAVVIGMRERRSACARVIELRLLEELYLSGSTPRGSSEVPEHETRALLMLPLQKRLHEGSRCKPKLTTRFDLRSISAGDRVALTLGPPIGSDVEQGEAYPWQRAPRILSVAGVHQLPELVGTLPTPRHLSDGEQEDLLPWPPVPGTPESIRELGASPRFQVAGDVIKDHAQGIAWQREAFAKPLQLNEAGWACQAARTAGYDDWRLPTARELATTFIDPSRPAVAGPRWLEPSLFGETKGSIWWSRTDDDGYYVGLAEWGEVASTHYDTPSPFGSYNVRCVRNQSARRAVAVSQFRMDTNTLADPVSGLVWQLPAKPRQRAQDAARQRCEAGSFAGHDDWRLPNQAEALSLMSRCPWALYDWSEESSVRNVWLDGKSSDGKYSLAARVCDYSPSNVGVFDSDETKAYSLCVRTQLVERSSVDIECPPETKLRRSARRLECLKGERREGPFVAFYPSGAVFEISRFHQGQRDGRFKLYHEQGGAWLAGSYDAGSVDGELIATTPSGERRTTQRFSAGVPSGTWHFYGPGQRELEWVEMKQGEPSRGQLSERDRGGDTRVVPTRRGLPHGIEEFHAKDSDFVQRSVVVLGQPDGDYEILEAGEVTQRGMNQDGLKHGLWIHVLPEGEERATYRRGVLDGPFLTLDGLGEVVQRREYRRGKPWGKWVLKDDAGHIVQRCQLDRRGDGSMTRYDSDGHKYREEPYRGGQLHGTVKTFRPDGRLESEEEYRDGVREGRSVSYSDAGKVVDLETYRGGVLDGPSESRYSDSQLRQRGNYAKGKRTGLWLFVQPTGAKFEITFRSGEPIHGGWE